VGPPKMLEGYLRLQYPIQHGMVEDWDIMEQIWDHTFDQLGATVGEQDSELNSINGAFLTEAARNPNKARERTVEVFFEKYNMDRFFIAIQAVLAMYSSGRLTGVAVDIGDGVTHTVPIYEGYTLSHAVHRSNIAGRDLTRYMTRCMMHLGHYFTTSAEKEICHRIKEEHCYVALDYDAEVAAYRSGQKPGIIYYMPDGQEVELQETLCQVPEYLFNSMKLENVENQPLHTVTSDTIMSCDLDVRKDLYENILLSGGTTLLPGLDERLHAEVEKLAPINAKVNVVAAPDRYLAVWLGGSILSSLSTFENNWIYKKSNHDAMPPVVGYDEAGARMVHTMCQM